MRSYIIRSFNAETTELALDFVINLHEGPATRWAQEAKVGDSIGLAGPGPLKLKDYTHDSYLLVGDITSVNAINGDVPRFKKTAIVKAIITVPTRTDIIEMDYDDSVNTEWFIEDETSETLEEKVMGAAKNMPNDALIFMGLEAQNIRTLKAKLQTDLGLNKQNIAAVGYWRQGVDADVFTEQKRANPL